MLGAACHAMAVSPLPLVQTANHEVHYRLQGLHYGSCRQLTGALQTWIHQPFWIEGMSLAHKHFVSPGSNTALEPPS